MNGFFPVSLLKTFGVQTNTSSIWKWAYACQQVLHVKWTMLRYSRMLFSPKNHVTLPLNFQQVGVILNNWSDLPHIFLVRAFLIEGFIYDFKIAGFSLSSWKISNGFNEEDRLPVHTAAKVHDLLKIPFYRLSSSCSRSLAPYAPTYIGWVECKSDGLTEMYCEKKINAHIFHHSNSLMYSF